MPLYDFRCTGCGRIEEHRLGFDDLQPSICGTCNGPLQRRFSPPRLHITGDRDDPLQATGADFLTSPDHFRDSMRSFEQATGLGLSSSEMDAAIDRLDNAT